MPGAFHTEVVPHRGGYRIYLLDLHWKNPTTQKSSVEAFIDQTQGETKLNCRKEQTFFFCQSKANPDGKLRLVSVRDGQKGTPVSYPRPLTLTKSEDSVPTKSDRPHQGH